MKYIVSLLIFGAFAELSFGSVIPPTFPDPLEDGAQEIVLRQKHNYEETWTPAPVPGSKNSTPPMSWAQQELIRKCREEFDIWKEYRMYAKKQYEEVEQEIRTPSGESPAQTLQTKLSAYKNEVVRETTEQLRKAVSVKDIEDTSFVDQKLAFIKKAIEKLNSKLKGAANKIYIHIHYYPYGSSTHSMLAKLQVELENARSSNMKIEDKVSLLTRYKSIKYLLKG